MRFFAFFRIFFRYFCLNVVSPLIPHPKLRASWLRFLGARLARNVRIANVFFNNVKLPLSNLCCQENAFIGTRVILDLSSEIRIGSRSCVSPGCTLITHQDPGFSSNNKLCNIYPLKIEPIQIGDEVWIGCDSTLLAGSSIGNYTVIGAKSLVTGSIPGGVLACGIPAKIKKTLPRKK